MTSRTRSVAMLAANPAFASILCRALEDDRGYRVPMFSDVSALTTFMRIAPVDMIVLDAEFEGPSFDDIIAGLRAHPRLAYPLFKTVVLTRAAAPFHRAILSAGADAVLQKPVAPAHLLDCIDSLLDADRLPSAMPRRVGTARPMPARVLDARPAPAERHGNVIPLFGEGRQAPR